jgi:hypothetical protein
VPWTVRHGELNIGNAGSLVFEGESQSSLWASADHNDRRQLELPVNDN